MGFAFSCLRLKIPCTLILLRMLYGERAYVSKGRLHPMGGNFIMLMTKAVAKLFGFINSFVLFIVLFIVTSCSYFLGHGSWFLQVCSLIFHKCTILQ